MKKKHYDFESSWKAYAPIAEEERFLSSSSADLRKICDVIDCSPGAKFQKHSGGIPIHYNGKELYVLKHGPHSRVAGDSGSKKSRTTVRGKIISAIHNGDSFIVNDPKGELCGDSKLQHYLKQQGVEVYVLDFRTRDKDGFNILEYAYDLYLEGKRGEAFAFINSFCEMLYAKQTSKDTFWENNALRYISSPLHFLLPILAQQKDGRRFFHLATLNAYLNPDQEDLKDFVERLMTFYPWTELYNPIVDYQSILENPDRTFSCIRSTALGMLKDFQRAEDLMRMLSVSTFDLRKIYQKPTGIFMVIPDETKVYNDAIGYLFDLMYEILISEFTKTYQNKEKPPCHVHIVVDEAASITINAMDNKVSASRSRCIDWTLIYQSDLQMEKAYPKDFPSIQANAKNFIFLGSNDYNILKTISRQTGDKNDGSGQNWVSIPALRGMKKEWLYKEALVMVGNHLYCAQLPDYDVYDFLPDGSPLSYPCRLQQDMASVYSPDRMLLELKNKQIKFTRHQWG